MYASFSSLCRFEIEKEQDKGQGLCRFVLKQAKIWSAVVSRLVQFAGRFSSEWMEQTNGEHIDGERSTIIAYRSSPRANVDMQARCHLIDREWSFGRAKFTIHK
jgi:hypothetical protein